MIFLISKKSPRPWTEGILFGEHLVQVESRSDCVFFPVVPVESDFERSYRSRVDGNLLFFDFLF